MPVTLRPAITSAPACGSAELDRADTTRHTIRNEHVHRILHGVRSRGVDIDPILRRAGISHALLDAPAGVVTVKQYVSLLRTLRRYLRDELWGLCDRPVLPGTFAQLCRMLIHCDTLKDAFLHGLRFYRLHLPEFFGRLHIDNGRAVVRLYASRDPETDAVASSVFLLQTALLANWLTARRLPLLHAEFRHKEPGNDRLQRLLDTDVRFNQAACALYFDARLLALPVVQSGEDLRRFLNEAPENLLNRYKDASLLTERIRRFLRMHLGGELPTLDVIAERLHMSPRSLRRHLMDEGKHFQDIKDELRRDVAIEYLERVDLPLQEIALRLGFSEVSTFHRAFKKWTGVAPGEYRLKRA